MSCSIGLAKPTTALYSDAVRIPPGEVSGETFLACTAELPKIVGCSFE